MSFLTSILRFFCLNFMLNRGSWNPNELHTSDKPRKILNEKFSTKSSKKEDTLKKPAWLKEWTISKGWVHNKSHLLELGRKKLEAMEDLSDSSSVSLENIDELISIKSSEITIKNEELSLQEDENVLNRRTEIRMSQIFKQVNSNYRDNFPICNHVIGENKELSLPQIYKERLLMERNGCNLFTDMWKYVKPNQKKKLALNNCKFTVNPVYDETKRIENHQKYTKKNSLGRNITLLNTLNAKTNLHEDTIYECSEENSANYNSLNNIYFNPVYAHLPLRRFENFNSNQISEDFTRFSTKTEKYVIRHIKIRIMLSLRVGRFKKINKNSKKKRRNIFGFKKNENKNVNMKVARIHDEQRRIGNGRTSVKIQNMRYGRLNVLRWLLWEAESREDMPALEKAIANNTTLALHYAAARGCLDCVRLLVDSSPELSANTQMDNDVTPVYLAAQEGHLEVLKFLVLEAGGSLYVRAKDGMAPIHAASQMGCLNCVKWMIQDQNVDPNLRDGDGATPLHFAASRGHLDTVRWLLKHGARLSLDKFGKSPINDAAENQQVECLNVLVQHGTTPDYQSSMEKNSNGKGCSCTRKGDKLRRGNSVASDCSNCKPKSISNKNTMKHNYSEPFYLHPPLSDRSMEPPHAPENGLYINPMSKHRHSASSSSDSSVSSGNGESFYLHNPQEVIYNRVKDLFETTQRQQGISALTVKVEVHSSSSGTGSDENLSSSDLSERSGEHEHDYEDIYMIREETKEKNKNRSRSRDSGSHSRSASLTSSTSGGHVVVHLTTDTNNNENKEEHCEIEDLPNKEKGAPQESGVSSGTSHLNSEDEPEKTKLGPRHSLPAKSSTTNSKILKRVTSVPIDTFPPPPPPPLPKALGLIEPDDEPRGAEIVEIVEEPTLRPSDILKGMCRSMSALSARRLNSSCSDLTIVSLEGEEADKHGPNLVNRQRVLPFIPPSFPSSASSNNLIKPSEYLKSIGDKRSSVSSVRSLSESEDTEEKKEVYRGAGPPPPPLPDSNLDEMVKKQNQPLSAISIQDLNSVQLRRTEKVPASKTFSAPTRSMSLQCLQSEPFLAQKIDLIAELKMSKDITGIKKMKIEKAKCDESKEKEIFSEITKQLTTTRFVEKVPEKDNTGNIIPVWKRQMLAKKAAEKARKELEEQLLREAEEKRLQAIPQWKRQLLQKKEEAETKMRSTIYTPKVVDDIKITKKLEQDVTTTGDNDNDYDDVNNDESIRFENESNEMEDQSEEETPNIIPWRAHLRKTNSKLNLLG